MLSKDILVRTRSEVERYRHVADMPRPPRLSGANLLRAMAAAWERAHIRAQPDIPRGVTKFRSLHEAQQARHQREVARIRGLQSG